MEKKFGLSKGTEFKYDGKKFEYSHFCNIQNEHICYLKTVSKIKEAYGFKYDFQFPATQAELFDQFKFL